MTSTRFFTVGGKSVRGWLALLGLPVLALPVLASSAAKSPMVYTTKFENPPFVAGSPLVGQDGWTGVGFLGADAAVISSAKPVQGKQSVRVRGADMQRSDDVAGVTGGYYDAIGSYRHTVDYDTGGKTVRVSANVRVDGAKTADGNNFFSASVATRVALDDGDNAGCGELAICSDGHVYGYSGNEWTPTFLASAPVTLGEWHNLAVEVNTAAQTFAFYVDGQFIGGGGFDEVPSTDNPLADYTDTLRRGSIITYAAPDAGSLKKADYSASYDNFDIRLVD